MTARHGQTPAPTCGPHSCDGQRHYTAVWDDDTGRWVPVDYFCPLNDGRVK